MNARRSTRPVVPRCERLESRLALSAASGGDPIPPDPPADPPPPVEAGAEPGPVPVDGEMPPGPGPVICPLPGRPRLNGPFLAELNDPAPGSLLDASPPAIHVSFSHPVVPDLLYGNVGIVRLGPDGVPEWGMALTDAMLDESRTLLTAQVTEALDLGTYHVWILGATDILDDNGNRLSSDDSMPLDLGTFTIGSPGVGLADAIDLGTIGAEVASASGSLDFVATPHAVALFRIELAPGHHWRLGLEVRAQRDGSPLDAALALFDAEGRPVATAEVGRGDAPSDPYLFAGFGPGIYYVGVSGMGNLPGQPGGYDPITLAPGTVAQGQAGGAYTLDLVADPVDTAPRRIRFELDHADPLDPNPTGFALGFSRALGVGSGEGLESSLSGGIRLVDGSGRSWPVLAVAYSEANALVRYVIRDRLPAGHYAVVLPAEGGLVDLAGLAPTAEGLPDGTLAEFEVPETLAPGGPDDLGALTPDAAERGLALDLDLEAGRAREIRFAVTVESMFTFETQADGGSATVRVVRDDGTPVPGSPDGDAPSTFDLFLAPGVYRLVYGNPGDASIRVHAGFRTPPMRPDLLLANGVGQGPALSLRLIAPTAPSNGITTPRPAGPPTQPPIVPDPAPGPPVVPDPPRTPTPDLPIPVPIPDPPGTGGGPDTAPVPGDSGTGPGNVPVAAPPVISPPATKPPAPLTTPPAHSQAGTAATPSLVSVVPTAGAARRDPSPEIESQPAPASTGQSFGLPVPLVVGLGGEFVGRPRSVSQQSALAGPVDAHNSTIWPYDGPVGLEALSGAASLSDTTGAAGEPLVRAIGTIVPPDAIGDEADLALEAVALDDAPFHLDWERRLAGTFLAWFREGVGPDLGATETEVASDAPPARGRTSRNNKSFEMVPPVVAGIVAVAALKSRYRIARHLSRWRRPGRFGAERSASSIFPPLSSMES